jgi:hypothetical protein
VSIHVPDRIAKLPVNDAGYPVPWFVATIDGKPDFRVIAPGRIAAALAQQRCWICGDKMNGPTAAFVIGPMCAVNRVSAEPPSHRECAVYAAKACPFLANPKKRRREGNKPESIDPAGEMIARNPGVALVWISRHWKPFRVHNGVLFDVGAPLHALWFAEGREATRDEVMASIDSGFPILMNMAEKDGPEAVAELNAQRDRAMGLVPA